MKKSVVETHGTLRPSGDSKNNTKTQTKNQSDNPILSTAAPNPAGNPTIPSTTKTPQLNPCRHITKLLAYSFPKINVMGNCYLVNEYAECGSLDHFWKKDFGREQLNFRRRVIIAYEVMMALQQNK